MKLYYKGSQEDIEKFDSNKGYDDHRCSHHNKCCDEHKYAHCCPQSPCPYPILFECSQGTGADIPKICPSKPFTARSLGCVTIDTSCLKNPVVKFDFCSIIKYKFVANFEPATLTFGLFKTCDDRHEIPCGTWEYRIKLNQDGGEEAERLTTSFCFSHCECSSCPGCCTYTVRIIDASNDCGDPLSVCNTSLSVIAKSGH
ncbi:DUF4489 domain-containing protein [Clostridium sp. MSJ-4]|uniref:DUF4489 domain-containing protein n=1 Tax=Clostridium simiarum TaxID=2841506 RepID=A0ABS6F172_9CLOT|nr:MULTISPECIES: DUF4489 domain-containing protein [Clostridium]MBU5592245.1 DUF4489 domain-containing protein [Clostridium simiarum]